MKVGQVVDWYGSKLRLIEFVIEIGINSYWYAIPVNGTVVDMYSWRTDGNGINKDFETAKATWNARKTSTKKERRWLKPNIKQVRNKFCKGRQV
jgi:hypothetical protein